MPAEFDMTDVLIKHVKSWKIETKPPLEWLVIWTDFPCDPSSPGFDAAAKQQLIDGALKLMTKLKGPERCFICSPDCPDGQLI
ncbi:hypothetical protein Msil_3407 [Methylocella silvestris BL2]|uniref:Uncharacterized protein n=1 Tax=Methylocella silvestris (strain DSM 15510 / CIP 108128 / LMG 27833 / NCIMB 13906 / BL2) TaxID=395965 RepID=B8ES90_METSB|nr:hypothetical protein Msil_3407 [Methylocella silvestris BL2]